MKSASCLSIAIVLDNTIYLARPMYGLTLNVIFYEDIWCIFLYTHCTGCDVRVNGINAVSVGSTAGTKQNVDVYICR